MCVDCINVNCHRALGDFEYKGDTSAPVTRQLVVCTPEIRSRLRVESDDLLILACDGVWDVMTSHEATFFLKDVVIKHHNDDKNNRKFTF